MIKINPQLKNYSLKIIGVTVACFILQMLVPGFEELFRLHAEEALFRPWMFLTAIFMHGGITHLAFNMIALLFFGPVVERAVGSKRFILLYLGAGIAANIVGIFFYPIALGASGAIMAILGALVILMPQLRVLIWGIFPMPMWMAGILWFILDFVGAVSQESGIGHIVHIAGMMIGLGYALIIKKAITGSIGFRIKKTPKTKRLSESSVDEWIKINT